jgi:hypothetical protein
MGLGGDGFLAELGAVAVASAYLEDELHRANVAALGGSDSAERLVKTLNAPGLIDLFVATHGAHADTAELGERCRRLTDARNRYVHGVGELLFETGPGASNRFQMRNRKRKTSYPVPTRDELAKLASDLRDAANHVWIQSVGLSQNWEAEAWEAAVGA